MAHTFVGPAIIPNEVYTISLSILEIFIFYIRVTVETTSEMTSCYDYNQENSLEIHLGA